MLGLDEGESCIGVAHRVAQEDVDSELTVLWFREMFSGAYLPVWVDAEMEDGQKQRAMTFAVNRKNPRYEGILNEETIARRIALAEGFIGTNRDYLFRTVSHLNGIGVTDGPLHGLAARVTELTKEGNQA
jgi:cation transport protein ChaC